MRVVVYTDDGAFLVVLQYGVGEMLVGRDLRRVVCKRRFRRRV